jgi:hypothetical protein
MGGIREKLYDAAEKFDAFLGKALKRFPPLARAVIVLLFCGLAGATALEGKTHLAYMLLACGIVFSLGALAVKGGKPKK